MLRTLHQMLTDRYGGKHINIKCSWHNHKFTYSIAA